MTPHPSPDRIFQTLTAYQASEALKTAIELDLFTALQEGRKPKGAARAVRILCDFLTIAGFLRKEGREYKLEPDAAAFLSRKSPMYIGSAAEFLASPELKAKFADLTATTKRGGAKAGGTVSPDNPVWVKFARAMAPLMRLPAELTAAAVMEGGPAGKTLDVAAGHGLFGLAVAKADPSSEIVALDWRGVLTAASANAKAAGLSKRFRALPGDAFKTKWGDGYGLVLLPNFLHHFDEPACVKLLKKARAALRPGGRVALVEFCPNPDRITPPAAATFSLVMLGSTPSGDAYTVDELSGMLAKAGFKKPSAQPLLPSPQTLLIAGT